MNSAIPVERHPLEPFLPENATVLMLGSFPPKHERWSMEFFYPNYQNDMWRIMGLIFFDDAAYFTVADQKRFDYDKVVSFCRDKGIAIYDTASAVRRLKDNASDKFLEVAEPTDIDALLEKLPRCRAIVTTGERATDTIVERLGCAKPAVGGNVPIVIGGRSMDFYRMPSSSRAYPLPLQKKAAVYRLLFGSAADI